MKTSAKLQIIGELEYDFMKKISTCTGEVNSLMRGNSLGEAVSYYQPEKLESQIKKPGLAFTCLTGQKKVNIRENYKSLYTNRTPENVLCYFF